VRARDEHNHDYSDFRSGTNGEHRFRQEHGYDARRRCKKVRYSGNPDADFALMMIPHHQGAIEMAEVELQFGADSRLRRLAQEIIVTQQSEIEVMKVAISDYPISTLNQRRTNWCTR